MAQNRRKMGEAECDLCQPLPPGANDRGLYVWENDLWRLWTLTTGAVPGYSFLTSKRHIPYITDMDGPEAATLGQLLSRLTTAIREATDAEFVHMHVFGDGASHLHFHLVPHNPGDALNLAVVREDVAQPNVAEGTLREIAARLADKLRS